MMKQQHTRVVLLLPALLSLMLVSTSCGKTSVRGGITPPQPFVTWQPSTTIPFLLVSDTPDSYECYLGLWHITSGEVSLESKPLFSVSGSCPTLYWDGGHGFGIAAENSRDKLSVTCTDPRVWAEVVSESDLEGAFAFTSEGRTFFAGLQHNYIVLVRLHDYRSGEHTLTPFLPSLPPGTTLAQVIGFRTDGTGIQVYCVTSRPGCREIEGRRVHEDIYGVLELTYSPGSPGRWRMVNPDVGVSYAGQRPSFTLYGDSLVICDRDFTRTLDLTTGKIEPFTAASEELIRIDPSRARSGSADTGGPVVSGGTYGEYLVLAFSYPEPATGRARHFIAFKNGDVVGQLVHEGNRLLAFKGEDKTFEASLPYETCYLHFPADVQRFPPPDQPAAGKTFGPDEFYAIWMCADYPDLFNESLRCDGWKSESIAYVLMTRFRESPVDFLVALSRAYPGEIEKVGDYLAYNAGYGDLDTFRAKLESLRDEVSRVREPAVVLPCLEEEYARSQEQEKQKDQVMGAVDCYFKAKYASRVFQQAVDLAFVMDLSSREGRNLYDYELGLIKYSLDCYRASGPGSGISSYSYHPDYETIEIADGKAEVVVYPRASCPEILTPNDLSLGDEMHRLTLVRRPGGWKIVSDSYQNEMTLRYPPGTDFEELLAERRVRVIDVLLERVEGLESGKLGEGA